MNITAKNFYGPQKYISEVVEYPPYITRVNMTRYGYESATALYDVVVPERPVRGISKWYQVNGVSQIEPLAIHRHIMAHFDL